MYDYHLVIESFYIDFEQTSNFDFSSTLKYKGLDDKHWLSAADISVKKSLKKTNNNINSPKPANLKTGKSFKSGKSSTFVSESSNEKNLDNRKLSPKKNLNPTQLSNLLNFLAKNCDYRFGNLSIETYSEKDLYTLPEIEELETHFYKISIEGLLSPLTDFSTIAEGKYEIGINWQPKGKDHISSIPQNPQKYFGMKNAENTNSNSISEASKVDIEAIEFQATKPSIPSTSHEPNFDPSIDFSYKLNNEPSSSKKKQKYIPKGLFTLDPSGKDDIPIGLLHLYKSNSISEHQQSSTSGAHDSQYGSLKNKSSDSILMPVENEKVLAVLAVPGYMTPYDFVSFVGMFRKKIAQFRVIRNSSVNTYTVLLKFREKSDANDFFNYYNGKSFSPLEPELCTLIKIASVTITSSAIPIYLFPLFYDEIPTFGKLIGKNIDGLNKCHLKNVDDDKDTNSENPVSKPVFSDTSGTNFFLDFNMARFDIHKCLLEHRIIELPTCPVCLERLDASASGLLTILCQHTFHCSCLAKWSDNSCPVCRFSQAGMFVDNDLFNDTVPVDKLSHLVSGSSMPVSSDNANTQSKTNPLENVEHISDTSFSNTAFNQNKITLNQDSVNKCAICDSTKQLWICIICGYIGCGRYKSGHAREHFLQTGHIYSMDLDSQRVWDYVGDGYVHRILLNTNDGKLVEVSAPETTPIDAFAESHLLGEDCQCQTNLNETVLGSHCQTDYLANRSIFSSTPFSEAQGYFIGSTQNHVETPISSSNLVNVNLKQNNHLSYSSHPEYSNRVCSPENLQVKKHAQINVDLLQGRSNYTQGHSEGNIEAVREKLASVATKYEITLKSQLEMNSRIYEEKIGALQNMCKEYVKKNHQMKQTLATIQQKYDLERSISAGLSENITKLTNENARLSETVEELQEQVRDLFVHFETLNKVERDSELKDLISNGDLQVGKPKSKKNKGKSKKK
ncbi:hypothetical protein BB560_001547 [Smittium megazygosporum]|uniref:RING-type domain-containing protein n=1 Tax=Smittium megazygosporum TaxID=133381 RepID=A0A2T9ZH91_9FUNG|nr:hypothetical protein BB560_001547 [Smittium megazygosporum]